MKVGESYNASTWAAALAAQPAANAERIGDALRGG